MGKIGRTAKTEHPMTEYENCKRIGLPVTYLFHNANSIAAQLWYSSYGILCVFSTFIA